jgi:hypothetical protein
VVLEERVVRLVETYQIEQSMVEVVVEHAMYAPMQIQRLMDFLM